MLIKYDGKSMLKRILCMILLLILAIMPIMIPAAQAVLVEAATLKVVEIIATVIIGSGFVFRAVEDARAAAGQIWDWLQTNRADVATFFRTWAEKYTGLDKINAGIRVSGQVIDAIKDAVNALSKPNDSGGLDFGNISSVTYSYSDILDLRENPIVIDPSTYNVMDVAFSSSLGVKNGHLDWGYTDDAKTRAWFKLYVNGNVVRKTDDVLILNSSKYVGFRLALSFGAYGSWNDEKPTFRINEFVLYDDGEWHEMGFFFYEYWPNSYTWPISVTYGDAAAIPVGGDLVYPSDDYIVKAPDLPDVVTDADGKELVVYPELPLNPADHLADIPLNPEGQKVEVPFDVPVDLSTGKALDDVGNPDKPGEGEGGNTGIWDWLKDLLQKILDAINGLIGALLDGLKALLISLFVPGDGFLTDAFNDMLSPLQNKLPIGAYTDLVSKLQNVGAKELQNVQVTLYGQTVTIIDWGYYKANKATFDDIIRGFVFILLLAYNINNIYKLVRNNDVLGKRRDEKL